MTTEKTKQKRVVSPAQYAVYRTTKNGLETIGCILLAIGLMLSIGTGIFGILATPHVIGTIWELAIAITAGKRFENSEDITLSMMSMRVGGILVGANALAFRLGMRAINKCRKMEEEEEVIPRTRRNAIHLPEQETLVRGSEQPSQTPETLLRAAHPEATPADQLLRPGIRDGQRIDG